MHSFPFGINLKTIFVRTFSSDQLRNKFDITESFLLQKVFLFPQSFVWFTKESYESCVAKVGLEPTGMEYQNRWNVKNIWIKGQYMVSNMVGSPLSSILSWLKNADCIVWIPSRLSLFKIATDRSSKHQNGQNFVRMCIFCGENTHKKNHIHKSFYLTSVSFLGPKYF